MVIISLAVGHLVSIHMFLLAFMPGKFPGRGKKVEIFCGQRHSNNIDFVR